MKRSVAFTLCLAMFGLLAFAAKASQDPAAAALAAQNSAAAADQAGAISATALPSSMGTLDERIARGFAIAPVELNLRGKNKAFVGLGSYIVNAQAGCNDCHTHPPYLVGGDPFEGQPTKINVAGYLAGGRFFGPGIVSPNITPDEHGLPAGLTFPEFLSVMRTGVDPDEPGELLQVMPWPVFRHMRWADLRAVYEYLRAIPSIE
jgi:hypothetical protein